MTNGGGKQHGSVEKPKQPQDTKQSQSERK